MIVYHCAPKASRESIMKYGIDTSRCQFNRWCGNEKGFYAFENLNSAEWYAGYMGQQEPKESFDIWQVDLPKNTRIYADLGLHVGSYDEDSSSIHIKQKVKPSRLKLLKTV